MGPLTSADVSLPFVQVRVRVRVLGIAPYIPLYPAYISPISPLSSPGHAQHRAQVPLLGIPLCAPQGGFEPPARHPNSPSSPSRHPTVGAPGRLLSPRLGIPPSAVRAALSPRRVFGVCRGPICFFSSVPS